MSTALSTITTFLKKYTTAHLVFAFMIFWTPVIVFLKIAGEVVERQPIRGDTQLLSWIHAQATPTLDSFFFVVTSVGNVEYVLPATVLLIVYLLYKKLRLAALVVTFGVGGAAAANLILKLLFHRDRPAFWHTLITETGYSFPSGHAMLSSALVLCVIAILWQTKWRVASIILGAVIVGLIGYSRLYLGVHYPTDIIAGWSVSALWMMTVLVVMRVATSSYRKHKTAQLAT